MKMTSVGVYTPRMTRFCIQHEDHVFDGILFIGDPHVWSRKPGRRRDPSFLGTVLGKLAQAARIANERNLLAVCLGDLLHDEHDHEPAMLIGLARVLQSFNHRMVCLVGNHDKDELSLSERNALLLLGVTHQLELLDQSGFWGLARMNTPKGETLVALGGTPYGCDIPRDVRAFLDEKDRALFNSAKVGSTCWITHEDLAFDGAYPNAIDLREIKGVDVAVNGHMHGTCLPQRHGKTSWYNPGNITRMSVDMAGHIPSVWAWSPNDGRTMGSAQGLDVHFMERIVLEHVEGKDIFDFEGRHARAAVMMAQAAGAGERSAFVEQLRNQTHGRTDDATFAHEALAEIMATKVIGEVARARLQRLVEQVAREPT